MKPNPTEKPAIVKKSLSAEMVRLQTNKVEALKRFGDGQPYDRERLVEKARTCSMNLMLSAIEAGRALILIQAHEEHGAFLQALDSIGISTATAYRYVHAAMVVGDNKNMEKLSLRKTEILYSLPEAKLKTLQEKGALDRHSVDDLDALPEDKLRDLVRKYRDRLKKGEEQVGKIKSELKAAREGAGTVSEEFSRFVSMARMGLASIATMPDLTEVERDALEREVIALKSLFAKLDRRVHPELYPVDGDVELGKREASARARKNIKPVTPAAADEDSEPTDEE